ncbi:unnamed protein product [Oppiella nova]|uniref:BLOC-1-related complex subunit 6 C-terminal helix domain-containing protein n=1 Tax=Oppiella nova TaxID=334625 RepID=A0A7R9QC77_9ACAR|nr:unnamed protein product [Oppiella nova]CAG2162330.1 unnamed protein product [Oppiella nova]
MSSNSLAKDEDNESTVSPLSANEENCDQLCNDLMTSSYNEISFSGSDEQTDVEAAEDLSSCDSEQQLQKKLSSSLSYGVNSSLIQSIDGHLVSYVAQDFEHKLKHSTSSPSIEDHLSQQSERIEFKLLNDLEKQSKLLSNNINSMLRHISESTHNITSLTVECISTYETCLNNTCDVIDSNIKSMYQLMAKCEELNQSMKPIAKLSEELKEVKRLLELFEKAVDYKM